MNCIKPIINLIATFLVAVPCFSQIPILKDYMSPIPKVVTPARVKPDGGIPAPSDAISLFNGTDLSEWIGSKGTPEWIVQDGMFTVVEKTGNISTKREFGDFQLHVEWMHPVDLTGEGQMRGNSGIFLHGLYEVQVLETFGNNNKTYVNGQAGAIYKQHAPLVNPLRPPGEWNNYDIIFTAPTFTADGSYKTNPRVTILLNGILIQNNTVIYGATRNDMIEKKTKGEIKIQDHGCTVNYRNIWVREL